MKKNAIKTDLNFFVGPSKLSLATKRDLKKAVDLNIPSLSHRSAEFKSTFEEAVSGLKELFSLPPGYQVFFVASATECMEILARNCVSKNSFHFINGIFSKRFMEISAAIGNRVLFKEVEPGRGFDFSREEIEGGLGYRPELVALNHTETTTGVSVPMDELRVFRARYPDYLLAIDIVSSAGALEMDFSLADAWFFSVQKGFGLPAGLAVLIVNERVLRRAEELKAAGEDIGFFHSLPKLWEGARQAETFETPNVLNIYLLREVTRRFLKTGLKRQEELTREKARLIATWAAKNNLALKCVNPHYQAPTVFVIEFPAGVIAGDFHRYLNRRGIFPGAGYKEMGETHFRLANFSAHSLTDFKKALKIIEEYFKKR